jgi:hypothetical protein
MHSFAGIIESSNFARKSMPIMGVAVAVGGGGEVLAWLGVLQL